MTNGKPVRIAVDAMGGDFAPGEIVKGAVQACRELGVEIILVGKKDAVEAELAKLDVTGLPVRFVEATQEIIDGEEPAFAVMRKPKSSMAIANRLVKEGEADAVISAGSTGGVMVSALQYLGTLPGVERPMAGGAFLSFAPKTVVLDLGANVGVQPYHLVDFAVAGSVYAKAFLGVENPTVGLLNVGAEEGKGSDFAKEAHGLLKQSGVNFIGNVEGMDIAFGRANVIVTDGFIGNIIVKYSEGLGRLIQKWMVKEFSGKMDAAELEKAAKKLYTMLSPAEALGGGPLIGVDGVACVAHGASKADQVVGTILHAKQAIDSGFVETLRAELVKAQANIKREA